jgi:hypothetical protein
VRERRGTYDDLLWEHRLAAGGGGVVEVVNETAVSAHLRHQQPESVLEPFAGETEREG